MLQKFMNAVPDPLAQPPPQLITNSLTISDPNYGKMNQSRDTIDIWVNIKEEHSVNLSAGGRKKTHFASNYDSTLSKDDRSKLQNKNHYYVL